MSTSTEIIFVNASLTDLDHLLSQLPKGAEVILLDSAKDGLEQMTAALAGRSDVSAVHIVGHGSSGSLQLGSSTLTSQNLESYAAQLKTLGSSLAPDGDILLYGCNVAAGETGASFISRLAALTGADIAASSNLTGAANLGGDWTLEAASGMVDATPLQAVDYNQVLLTTYEYHDVVEVGSTYNPAWSVLTGLTPGGSIKVWNYLSFGAIYGRELYVESHAGFMSDSSETWIEVSDADNNGVYDWYLGSYVYSLRGDSAPQPLVIYFDTDKDGTADYQYNIWLTNDKRPYANSTTITMNDGQTSTLDLTTISADNDTVGVGWVDYLNWSGDGVSGSTMTYTAASNPTLKGTVSVTQNYTIDDGYFSASNTVTYNVVYANDAPTLTAISTLGGATEDTAYTISYADLAAASNLVDPDDATPGFKITQVSSGTLTKNGSAVELGTVLNSGESLVWTPAAEASGTLDAFKVVATDGSLDSGSSVQVAINVAAVNDAPAIGGISGAVTINDTQLATPFSAVTFSDGDSANVTVTVSLDTAAKGGFTAESLTASGFTALEGGVYALAASSPAAAQTAIRNLVYNPTDRYVVPPGSSTTTFTIAVNDGTTTSTNSGTTVVASATNNVPTLDSINTLTGALEDNAYTISYDALAGAANEADADADPVSFRVETVSSGTLTKNGVAVTPGTTLLGSGESLVWTPAANANGSALNAFTVKAWDGYAVSGGGALQVAVDVTAINDAPAGADATLTLAEDGSHTLTAANFGFTDPTDAGAGQTLAAVKITSLPAAGSLTLNGVAVTTDTSISRADLDADKLVFTPAANANGSGYASFTFQVQDSGGTANGGVDLDQSANTITFTVTPVNDAPVLTPGGSDMTTITEDATTNAGHLVSELFASRTDLDTATNGAGEGTAQGIAISSTTVTSLNGGGTWQYSTDNGANWSAIGTVSDSQALLLRSTDKVRFVPDGENAQTASFSYYAWDQASGSAGDKVDASTRGTTSAFSTAADTVSISTTDVNDAPLVNLDADSSSAATGYNFSTDFLFRGSVVYVADTDMQITDVDKTDASHSDTLCSATVAITAGAIDNNFGTIYETLTSGAGSSVAGTLGTITITGSGTTGISISGTGTWDEYESIIKQISYNNSNPNAYHGDRTITVTVKDNGITTLADDKLDSNSPTTTVESIWAPVIDTNGIADGMSHTPTFTEGAAATVGTPVSIATADSSVTDQDSTIASMIVSISNVQDAGAETLTINYGNGDNWAGIPGMTVSGSGTTTITISGNLNADAYQLAIRSISYTNSSDNPDSTQRDITLIATDSDGYVGPTGHSYVTVVPRNDAPLSGGDKAATLNEGALYTVTTADLSATDVDDAAATLRYVLTADPTNGTLFRDANGNSAVDDGEALANTDGFTQADVDAGLIKYQHNGSETTSAAVAFKVEDGLENGVVAPTGTLNLTISPVNDTPVGLPVISGTAALGEVLTVDTSGISDADGLGAFSYLWKADGVAIGGATGSSYTLTGSETGKAITVTASYTDGGGTAEAVTSAATAAAAHVNTAPTGLPAITGTVAQGQTLTADTSGISDADGLGAFSYQWLADGVAISGATSSTFVLTSSENDKAMTVTVSYTDVKGTAESLTSAATGSSADLNDAPTLAVTGANPVAFNGSAALFSGAAISTVESGQTIESLTLTVSGLADAAHEKLKLDGQTVALTAATSGTTTVGSIGYSVAVAGSTATVTLTKSDTAANWQTIINSLAYQNDAATPGGLRIATITGIKDSGGTAGGGQDTATVSVSSTVVITNNPAGTTPIPQNTAPTAGGDDAFALNEGAAYTLLASDLSATDAEQPAGSLNFVVGTAPANGALFRDGNANGTVDAGEAIAATGSFSQLDLTSGRIKYRHDGSDTTADSFAFTVSDGLLATGSATAAITINAANDAPTLTATATSPTFTEGGAAAALFSGSAAGTVEAGQNLTVLKLTVAGLADGAAEKLTVDGTSVALTNGTSGNTAAHTVGYSVAVSGSTATVTLTKTDSTTNWQTVIDGLAYSNSSLAPTSGSRVVTLTQLSDDGGTANGGSDTATLSLASTVTVAGDNNAPTLTAADFSVTEGGSFTVSTTQLAAADSDTALTSLVYSLATAPTHGTLYIDADSDARLDSGEALATDGTFTYSQLSGGKLRYQHDGNETGDSFGVTVSDGIAASAQQAVNVTRTAVNDAPTIANLNGNALGYPANSGAKLLDVGSDVTVTDPDSADFNNGSLRVSIALNNDPGHDLLSIKNVGTGAGQISTSGSNVSYANTVIGSFAGGSGSDLVVSLNSSATPEAVQALVGAIQFSNNQTTPASLSRNVTFSLSDGDGGLSQTATVNVTISANNPPSIVSSSGFYVAENTSLVTVISATDPASLPISYSLSGGADQSSFAIDATTGQLRFTTAPDYETPGDVGADNIYNVTVRATNSNAAYVEAGLVVNLVDVDNEAGQAAAGDTSGPAFGYATVNGTSLVMAYTDASNLDATNVPATGSFTVSGNTVTGVAVSAASKTVTLTLGTAVAYGSSVTVAYTDPTGANDVNALQDASGNDVATMAATAVTNLAAAPAAPATPATPASPATPTTPVTPPPVTPVTPSQSPVTPAVEDRVPGLAPAGGGAAVAGDGNGDGTADSQQGSVVSTPFLYTPTPVSNPGTAAPVYVSLVADSRAGFTDTTDSNSAQLTAISQLDAPTLLPSTMTMPMGMFSFTADIEQSGITETFSLFVDSSVVVNGYWVQGSGGFWQNLATRIETVDGKTRIDFSIADGGLFDADGLANGLIEATGAAGSLPLSIVGAVQAVPPGGFWF